MQTHSMAGKTCLVTGATAGIGEVTATALAGMGARVLLVSRDQRRGDETLARIRQAHPAADVSFLQADLSSQAEIRRLAAEVLARLDRLDVLVNNAGAVFMERKESVDGIEMTLALNHINYFLLTNLLLPLLKASAPARIVSVASTAHKMTGLNFDDLQGRRSFNGMVIYGQSKLANIVWTNELARRLAGSGVTANSLHPGVVATKFGHNNQGLAARLAVLAFKVFGLSPEKGARTSIHLASSPAVEGVTGTYFVNRKPAKPAKQALDPAAGKLLWEISEQLTAGAGAQAQGGDAA
ncbi:MAG TPA: SDR family oxidoreductase [Herpetosiphonaceae bacterium]